MEFSTMKKFNQLSPAQEELLYILSEECAEVVQITQKILRHGYESYSPMDPDGTPNISLLEKELGHVLNAIHLLVDKKEISLLNIEKAAANKRANINVYLHHNEVI